MDGSTGLLDAAGEWNGVNCQCRAGGFARVDSPASNLVFDHMNIHDTVGGALYTFSSVGGALTNVTWQNSSTHHNGWNYPGSMITRFGAVGSAPTCSSNPSVLGCPEYYGEYYSHTHSFYLGTGGNILRNNYIYDDAGYCIQLFNGKTFNAGANTIDSNWIANCGWKSKTTPHSLNSVGGWNAQYSGGTVFSSNVFLNNVAGYVLSSDGIVFNNNLMLHGAHADAPNGPGADVIEWDATRNARFTNNVICFNRNDAGDSKDQMFVGNAYGAAYAPLTASIASNDDLGPTWAGGQERVFKTNAGNIFGCPDDRFAGFGYVPAAGVPSRDLSLRPGLLLEVVQTTK